MQNFSIHLGCVSDRKEVLMGLIVTSLKRGGILFCLLFSTCFADIIWQDSTCDHRWDTAANWSGMKVPDAANGWVLVIGDSMFPPTDYPLIVTTVPAIENLEIGADGTGQAILTICEGGNLVVQNIMNLGDWTVPGVEGVLVMNGGSLQVGTTGTSKELRVGVRDTEGAIFLNGGSLKVSKLIIPYSDNSAGRIYLSGGILEVDTLSIRSDPDRNMTGLINIEGGIFILEGNRVQTVQRAWARRDITAYGGNSELAIDYDMSNPGKTTVRALPYDPLAVRRPDPKHRQKEVSLTPTLSWIPADDAFSHDIYWGEDMNQVEAASRFSGDINGDRVVDVKDLADWSSGWLSETRSQESRAPQTMVTSFFGQSPYRGTPAVLSSRIEIEDYDRGENGLAYYDVTAGNDYGYYRYDDVDITVSSDIDNGFVVMGADQEWLEYTVYAAQGCYDLRFRVACAYEGRNIIVKLNDFVIASLVVPNTGGWDVWQTVEVENVPVSITEVQLLRIELQGGLMALNWLEFSNRIAIADLNGDTRIDLNDFALLAANWYEAGPEVFLGNQTTNTISVGPLDYGRKYFWRVDEVTPRGILKGPVWEFETEIFVPTDKHGRTLTFHDEFNDEEFDWTVWECESASPGHILSGRWPENITVENGTLRLKTKKENRGSTEWTTGHIWTRQFKQKYGYWEARYKIGNSSGLNNAFWMIESGDFEIDIDEGHYPDEMNMNLHNWKGTHWGSGKTFISGLPLSQEYHTRALEWTPTELIWYFDDQEVRRIDHTMTPADPNKEVAVRFSTAVLDWAGEITDMLDGTVMDIDYVRVYTPRILAYDPYPANNAVHVGSTVQLGWSAAFNVSEENGHHIYFGTDADAVLNADENSDEYKGMKKQPIFDPGPLAVNTTYYWRVDPTDGQTVLKGDLWQFTTWLQAPELIAPSGITATASGSSKYGDRKPVYAVNSSGLTGKCHTNSVNGTMWMTDQRTGWFKIDLDNHYDLGLYEMNIWNFNMAGYTGRGVNQVDIYYSDSPIDPERPEINPSGWTLLGTAGSRTLTQATGDSNYDSPDKIIFPAATYARWIFLDINSNFNGENYVGLSEISFEFPASIQVVQFGAYPDDNQEDAIAIRQAFSFAQQNHIRRIVFGKGQYDLYGIESRTGKGWANLFVMDMPNLIIEGAVNSDGSPATRIVRHYAFSNDWSPKAIMHLENCPNLQFRNFLFDNDPQYCTAGQVVEKTDTSVTVDIFNGLPYIDGTIAYCANAWDLSTGMLKHVESLTYGSDVDERQTELTWHTVAGGDGRRMRLDSSYFTDKIEVGDGISWHFGWNGLQLKWIQCDDLYLENLKTVNAIGFAMIASNCRNIRAKNIRIQAEGNQLAVGPRDGWKLYACQGTVLIEDMYCEGVRWDGQNVHGTFCRVSETVNSTTIKMVRQAGTYYPITIGSKILLWDGPESFELTVNACTGRILQDKTIEFTVSFNEAVPEFVTANTIASIYAWNIDSYTLKNCTFAKIAGCASIIRNDGAVFDGCIYRNIMYPAIVLGASIWEGEGTFTRNVLVRECLFSDSGWVKRQNAEGLLGIRTGGSTQPYMKNIQIINNTFKDARIGIDITGAKDILIKGNWFQNVSIPWRIDPDSTDGIIIDDNTF